MVGLGGVEGPVGSDLGGDRSVARSCQQGGVGLAAGLGQLQQLGIVHKDRGAVLAAAVIALAVALGGVVAFPEELEQIAEVDPLPVPHHPHHLRMAGASTADLLIAGGNALATGIAHGGGDHTGQAPEAFLRTPETAAAEEGFAFPFPRRRPDRGVEHGVDQLLRRAWAHRLVDAGAGGAEQVTEQVVEHGGCRGRHTVVRGSLGRPSGFSLRHQGDVVQQRCGEGKQQEGK